MGLLARLRAHRSAELIRFYQAAIVNTLFGYGVYAVLIASHVHIYAAQAIAYCTGSLFNYFTYSRHAFPEAAPAKLRFLLAYVANYLLNLGLLALFERVLRSPYLIGMLVMIIASLLNYLALKYVVFTRRAA